MYWENWATINLNIKESDGMATQILDPLPSYMLKCNNNILFHCLLTDNSIRFSFHFIESKDEKALFA